MQFPLLDRVEAQLDYWREDPMLHAFHCILHAAWSHCPFLRTIISPQIILSGKLRKLLKMVNSRANMRHFGFPTLSSWRGGELWCPDVQWKVRYGVERLHLGIPPVVPLDPQALKGSLGPGYTVGYFGSGFDLGDRFWSKKKVEKIWRVLLPGLTTVLWRLSWLPG